MIRSNVKNFLKTRNYRIRYISNNNLSTRSKYSYYESKGCEYYDFRKDLCQLDSEFRINMGVHVVPENEARVIHKWGTFYKTLEPGLHFLNPITDKVASVHSMKEQTFSIKPQEIITKNDIKGMVEGLVTFQVQDPKILSKYVEKPYETLHNIILSTVSNESIHLTMSDLLSSRTVVSNHVSDILRLKTHPWGIYIKYYEISNIIPEDLYYTHKSIKETQETTQKDWARRSENSRKDLILNAKGTAEAIKIRAEAEAEAIKTKTEAERDSYKIMGTLLKEDSTGEGILKFSLALKTINTWGLLAEKGANIPVNPTHKGMAEALSTFDSIKKL
jgi:regulator of protease activity HflC (stomatin/prohibitin superfamily)